MAFTISSQTSTTTSITMNLQFTESSGGTYYMVFYCGSYSHQSSNFTLSSGGSKTLSWTFSGLDSGTSYYLNGKLYNASTDALLLSVSNPKNYSTESSSYTLDITYHSGNSYKGQTITGSGTIQSGSIFTTPSGYSFEGWATSYGTISVSSTYAPGKSITPTSSDVIDLYAVYSKTEDITCYYGVNQASSNSRTCTSYRYNSSDAATTTKKSTITLPNFNPSTITVLSRTFTGIGWRTDTSAKSQAYDPGATITPTVTEYYAVYSNGDGIVVTYNSNGGSGTMSSATVSGTLYYNTYGNNTTITVTPRSNGFTPPSGCSFAGWSTSSSGSVVTSISTAYNVTFYAIWQSAKPARWAWTSTIGGTLALTQAGTNTYEVYPLTAKEWNAFLDRIREWGEHLNISLWDSDFTNAAAIQNYPMEAGNAIFAVSLLQQLGASPPSAPSSGSPITASFINGLATALNKLGYDE